MPIAHDFEFKTPRSLGDALALMVQHRGAVSIVAGGTDLLVWLKEGKVEPRCVLNLKAIPELAHITAPGERLVIGASVTFSDIIAHPLICQHFPVLKEASETVASIGVRNRATLVGNICSAVPSLDSAPALLVHDAVVHVQSVDGQREIPIEQWFLAPRRTALRDHELVTAVSLPLPKGTEGAVYVKLGRYAGEDLAQAGLAVRVLAPGEYRVAHCALGPIPRRCPGVEALLAGKELTPELLVRAREAVVAEISPITDVRASKEYRLLMTQVMLERGLEAAVGRREGKPCCHGQILGG